MPPKLGQKSFLWDYFVTVEPVEGQKGQAKRKWLNGNHAKLYENVV
jgi:hypothetical protein